MMIWWLLALQVCLAVGLDPLGRTTDPRGPEIGPMDLEMDPMGLDINEPFAIGNGMAPGLAPGDLVPRDSSEGLSEFTPIRATIAQSQTQYYSFNVNTSTGVGQYYEFLIFLTGNICSQPSNIAANDTSLAVYYSFNSSMFQNLGLGQMELFKNGYFQALADIPITKQNENQDAVLYIAVRAPENTDRTSQWSYQIGVSQNDLVFQWDDRSWASLVDADDNSALIVTGNLTATGDMDYSDFNTSNSRYSLFIYSHEYKDYFASLNSSWCAVRNGPALLSTSSFESTFTHRGGGLQQQFYVDGLNSSTKYVAYLVSDFQGRHFGGAVYQPFQFETMDENSCKLIYDLDFCDLVAYAVPNNPDYDNSQLRDIYDNRAKALYQNFSKALDQVSCNISQDQMFLPFRNCDDCAYGYKNWLCSVTIPRCSTRNITGYQLRDPGQSRNEWIDEFVEPSLPYYEMLPCLNVCQIMVRDCPADFGFACPTTNDTIKLSYYWDEGSEFPTCNFVGKPRVVTSGATRLLVSWVGWLGLVMVGYLVI